VRARTTAPKRGADDGHGYRPSSDRRFTSERPRAPEPVGEAAIGILSRAFPENVTAASKELRRRNRDAVLVPRLQDDAAVEKRLSRIEAVIDANARFPWRPTTASACE
jgi:hypothetical protein